MFLCIRCAGIHRNLGVHISKVKSVDLDSWTTEQIEVTWFPIFLVVNFLGIQISYRGPTQISPQPLVFRKCLSNANC